MGAASREAMDKRRAVLVGNAKTVGAVAVRRTLSRPGSRAGFANVVQIRQQGVHVAHRCPRIHARFLWRLMRPFLSRLDMDFLP